jgi:uncharacterized protein (TIGR03435 family)
MNKWTKLELILVFLIASEAFSQSNPAPKPETAARTSSTSTPSRFDVVSIKPNIGHPYGVMSCTADGYSSTSAPLATLISSAYGVGNDQVLEKPSWGDTQSFEVQAKVDPADVPAFQMGGRKLCHAMLRELLADRFKLVVSQESRMLPVYDLEVGKGGPRFKESSAGAQEAGGSHDGYIAMHAISMSTLANIISGTLQSPVSDKTGLKGKYDVTLTWTGEEALGMLAKYHKDLPSDSQETIFEAVEDQLGLKLVQSKGPVQVIVVKHAERPSTN